MHDCTSRCASIVTYRPSIVHNIFKYNYPCSLFHQSFIVSSVFIRNSRFLAGPPVKLPVELWRLDKRRLTGLWLAEVVDTQQLLIAARQQAVAVWAEADHLHNVLVTERTHLVSTRRIPQLTAAIQIHRRSDSPRERSAIPATKLFSKLLFSQA